MSAHKSIPTDEQRERNRRAARKQAEKMDFDPSEVKFCPACGRTIVQKQKMGNSGFEDSVFCTCEDIGLPMTTLENDDEQ